MKTECSNSSIEVRTDVKQGALIGAWVCLIIGAVLNIVSNFLVFLFAPLYLVAFILGIVAMAQRRILGGLVALLLSIILPICICSLNIALFAHAVKASIDEQETEQPVAVQESASPTASQN